MQLIVDQTSELLDSAKPERGEGEAASATSFLLDQLSGGKAH
jgi:hypothetical protein